jgi:hypothetical protein
MKKNMKWITLTVILFFTPQSALAGNVYIPAVVSPLTATTAAITQSARINYSSRLGVSTNIFRGDFAENLMRGYFSGGGDLSSNKTWYSLDPGGIYATRGGTVSLLDPLKPGRTGIDGLFVQADRRGNPTGLMLGESKFGSSQLGQTTSGKQMSDDWAKARLKAVSTRYERMAALAKDGRISQSLTPPKTSQKITELPLSNKQSARIWYDNTRGSYVYYSKEPVDVKTIARQLNKMGQYTSGAAEGKISVGKNLWRVEVKHDGSFLVTTEQVDAQGNPVKNTLRRVESLSGRYEQLTSQSKKFLDKSLTDTLTKHFENNGYPPETASKNAQRELKMAKTTKNGITDLVKKYNLDQARWNWRASGKVALKVGMIGAGIPVIFDVGFASINWLRGERFSLDAGRTLKNAGLVFISTSGGTMAGLAVSHFAEKRLVSSSQSLLIKMVPESLKNSGRLSSLLGGATGGLVASAIIAYVPALLNGEDLSAANRMMVTGTASTAAGVLAGYAIIQAAMYVGTASTGTAISTLSGAVATKAALAWLGGGAISAGGLGVTAGGTVVSGGTLLIAAGAGFLISKAWSMLDENNNSVRVERLLNAYK